MKISLFTGLSFQMKSMLPLLEYLHNIASYCCKNLYKTYTQKYLIIFYYEASLINEKSNV